MTAVQVLLTFAVACGLWAGVSAVLIARSLEASGTRTPFPLWGLLVFRNLHRYTQITRARGGRPGPLFYSYVVSINAALVLVLVALAVRGFAR